jgi:predicted PurR-regulated permease PerM
MEGPDIGQIVVEYQQEAQMKTISEQEFRRTRLVYWIFIVSLLFAVALMLVTVFSKLNSLQSEVDYLYNSTTVNSQAINKLAQFAQDYSQRTFTTLDSMLSIQENQQMLIDRLSRVNQTR